MSLSIQRPTDSKRRFNTLPILCGLALFAAWAASTGAQKSAETTPAVMPEYDEEGRLLLPEDYEQWIFAGSSLGMSYSEGSGGREMFHHTLIEPTAYAHFRRTGEFRQGSMFVLLLHDTGEGVLPQRRGRFADRIGGLEMAVKDAEHSNSAEIDWAYYGFGGAEGIRDRATAFPASACASCHVEHADYDNVFLQFYPLLANAAPTDRGFALARSHNVSADEVTTATAPVESEAEARDDILPVVLTGYDPVLLSEGHQELGKAEIVVDHGGFRYQFVSEPTRARFVSDPQRYGVQNSSCPVVPGATVDPDLYAVHEGKIYLFASSQCVETFENAPGSFLTSGQEASDQETSGEAAR